MADIDTQIRQHPSISKETALQALNTIIQLHFEKTLEKKRAIDLQKKELHKLFQLFFIFLALIFLTQSLSPRLECRHCWIPIALLSVSHLSFYVSVAQTLRCINGFKYQRRCHKLTLGFATERLREMRMKISAAVDAGFDGGVTDEEFEIHYQEPPESYLATAKEKMGACATKPKDLKAESGDAPEELPAETKPDHVGDEKAKEIVVDDDKVDSKPPLTDLFIHQVVFF